MRFQALILATAEHRNAASSAENTASTSAHRSSGRPSGRCAVNASVSASAAHSRGEKTPASRHTPPRSSFTCGTPSLRAMFKWCCTQKVQPLM